MKNTYIAFIILVVVIGGFIWWSQGQKAEAAAQKQAPYEEVLEFTADKAGSFEYYCSVGEHKAMGMVGTLKVEE